uniref:cyclin-dependent kinase n=1 Tax=Macrostomum lignano TaxID=282301 RepID=A0A1I8FTP4_9PLAT
RASVSLSLITIITTAAAATRIKAALAAGSRALLGAAERRPQCFASLRQRGGGGSPTPLVADLLALSKRDRRSSLADIGFGKITSYRKLDKLGQGTYATVYRGKSLLTDSLVALKEIRLEHDEGAPCTAIREVSLLRDLKHANIVTLHDIIHTDKSLTLVFEYLDKDLKQCLEECSGLLHEGNVRLYLYQLPPRPGVLPPQALPAPGPKATEHPAESAGRVETGRLRPGQGELRALQDLLKRGLHPSGTGRQTCCWATPSTARTSICGEWRDLLRDDHRPANVPGSTVEEQLQLIFRTLGSPTEESWPGSESNQQLQAYNFPHWLGMDLKSDLMRQLLQYQANRRISAEKAKLHPYFMQFMPAILNDLPDTSSIFEIPGVCLYTNPVPHCRAPAGCSGAVLPVSESADFIT